MNKEDIKVGEIYHVKKHYPGPIIWGNLLGPPDKQLEFKQVYLGWESISNKEIEIIGTPPNLQPLVRLVEFPEISFHFFFFFLTKIEKNEKTKTCQCSTRQLMIQGCTCGAFKAGN